MCVRSAARKPKWTDQGGRRFVESVVGNTNSKQEKGGENMEEREKEQTITLDIKSTLKDTKRELDETNKRLRKLYEKDW